MGFSPVECAGMKARTPVRIAERMMAVNDETLLPASYEVRRREVNNRLPRGRRLTHERLALMTARFRPSRRPVRRQCVTKWLARKDPAPAWFRAMLDRVLAEAERRA